MKPVQDSTRNRRDPTNTYTLINKEHLLTHEERIRKEKKLRDVIAKENYEPVSAIPSDIIREI